MIQAISPVTNTPYYSTPKSSLDERIRQRWNIIDTTDYFVRSSSQDLAARQLKGLQRLAEIIGAEQVEKHFKDNRVVHPVIAIIAKIKEILKKSPEAKKLKWIRDWKLYDVDYENIAKLVNMHDGKYIAMWQETGADGVPNMQKLALLEKVLRRNGAMRDIAKLEAGTFDALVQGTCSAKSEEEMKVLLAYITNSDFINPFLSGQKTMTSEVQIGRDILTKILDSTPTKYPMTVYKGSGYNLFNLLTTIDGKPTGDAMQKMVNAPESVREGFIGRELIGKTLFQKRFFSTTPTKDIAQDWAYQLERDNNAIGNILLEMTVPTGTRGQVVEIFNLMHGKQNEFLIQRNCKLKIIDVKFDETTKTWIIEIALRQID